MLSVRGVLRSVHLNSRVKPIPHAFVILANDAPNFN